MKHNRSLKRDECFETPYWRDKQVLLLWCKHVYLTLRYKLLIPPPQPPLPPASQKYINVSTAMSEFGKLQ